MGSSRRLALASFALSVASFAGDSGLAGVQRRPLFPMSWLTTAPGIAVDPGGTPHVLFPDADLRLRHAWREDGTWVDEPVDPDSPESWPESMATDSTGRIHAVFQSTRAGPAPGAVRYGVRDGNGWTLTDLGPGRSVVRIALGPDDLPRVFRKSPDGDLEVDSFDGTSWTATGTGLPPGDFSYDVSFVVDGEGHGHALYHRESEDFPRYATDASGAWMEVPLPDDVGRGCLAVDPGGRVHVVAEAGDPREMRLVQLRKVEAGWESDTILSTEDPRLVWFLTDCLSNARGRLFVAFTEVDHGRDRRGPIPRLAYHDGEAWRVVAVGGRNSTPWSSMALAPDGSIHAAAFGERVQHVRLALPDLDARWEPERSSAVAAGSEVRAKLRVSNQGPGASRPARVAYYLSEDERFDPGDIPIGLPGAVRGLRPGRGATLDVRFSVPEGEGPGFLLAVLDPEGRLDDLDRPGNTAALPLP